MERASAASRQQGVQFPKQEVLTGSNPNMLTKPDFVNLGVVSRDTAQGYRTFLVKEKVAIMSPCFHMRAKTCDRFAEQGQT